MSQEYITTEFLRNKEQNKFSNLGMYKRHLLTDAKIDTLEIKKPLPGPAIGTGEVLNIERKPVSPGKILFKRFEMSQPASLF